ncbi:LUD domain-containing protein [Chloroflexota bacterium]
MFDEKDTSEEERWFYEQRAGAGVANLQRRNTNAQYVSSRREALSAVLEMIPEGVTAACGDSITLEQVGIIPELRKRNQNNIINPMERDADGTALVKGEQRLKMQREAFSSSPFSFSSSNRPMAHLHSQVWQTTLPCVLLR